MFIATEPEATWKVSFWGREHYEEEGGVYFKPHSITSPISHPSSSFPSGQLIAGFVSSTGPKCPNSVFLENMHSSLPVYTVVRRILVLVGIKESKMSSRRRTYGP
jgi:hypothetical protein